MEEKININLAQSNHPAEIIVRHGDAPMALDPQAPIQTKIKGVIGCVVEYLKKRVAVFTIPKFFFDEGYIEPGEQYLQLRYIPAKVTRR